MIAKIIKVLFKLFAEIAKSLGIAIVIVPIVFFLIWLVFYQNSSFGNWVLNNMANDKSHHEIELARLNGAKPTLSGNILLIKESSKYEYKGLPYQIVMDVQNQDGINPTVLFYLPLNKRRSLDKGDAIEVEGKLKDYLYTDEGELFVELSCDQG